MQKNGTYRIDNFTVRKRNPEYPNGNDHPCELIMEEGLTGWVPWNADNIPHIPLNIISLNELKYVGIDEKIGIDDIHF